MAYNEYRKSGRTLGKVLYQLHTIGIPLHIVERVTVNNGVVKDGLEIFATYTWTNGDNPVFKFKNVTYDLVQHAFYKRAHYSEGSEFSIKSTVNHIHSGKIGKLKKRTRVNSSILLLDFSEKKFFPVQWTDVEPINVGYEE